jgi:indolepyruvate ferredoxin oxidoreductase beta subunit
MKRDILLAGVGGQGAISIAAAIATAALDEGLSIKQAETHGMSQRGGAVVSHLRYSSDTVYSDLIEHGQADLIIAIEPMEALRYVEYLAPTGTVVTNITPVVNIPNYPEMEGVLGKLRQIPDHVLLDAEKLAKAAATAKAANMVLLGASSHLLGLKTDFEALLRRMWQAKGDKVVESNIRAFRFGRDAGALYHRALEQGVEAHDALTLANNVHPESDLDVVVPAWAKALQGERGRALIKGLEQKRELVKSLPDELEKELEPAG